MDGRATFTTVMSKTIMSWAHRTTARVMFRRSRVWWSSVRTTCGDWRSVTVGKVPLSDEDVLNWGPGEQLPLVTQGQSEL